ncbi:hypothetical protein V6N13_065571 [Hibiscus sabdariffa]|uniref:C2H2-type domain-containing protein n=1 Tax=Hibiscus sabdariffa TaxID=183260 RepID=A0ABR2QQG4_9ROSI
MEKHKCKVCARTFFNGRALGGHLANHPLPPKTTHHHHQFSNRTNSPSSSSSSPDEEQEKSRVTMVEDKPLGYGLKEIPKKSTRFADPEFSFAVDSWSVGTANNATIDKIKKPKMLSSPSLIDSPPTNLKPVSSISDTSLDEDVEREETF